MYGQDLQSVKMEQSVESAQKPKVDKFFQPVEKPEIEASIQLGILGPLLKVACALLHSDYDHEYRAGLNIISHVNKILPIGIIITTVEKQSNANPVASIQECFWRGLVADQDQLGCFRFFGQKP